MISKESSWPGGEVSFPSVEGHGSHSSPINF